MSDPKPDFEKEEGIKAKNNIKSHSESNTIFETAFYHAHATFEDLIYHKTTRGVVLLISTILALIAINSPLSGIYLDLINMNISLKIGGWELEETARLWVNDGLMAIFFLAVGLEIKKELVTGYLSTLRLAALPLVSAAGGMLAPALIFLAINPAQPMSNGWGVPMATDIAFVIGVMTLLGDRAPRSLYIFLITLAIVDDLGAVMIIAIFYTDDISFSYLTKALFIFGFLVLFNLIGVRKPLPYFFVGMFLWFAMLKSGINATITGIMVAAVFPVKPQHTPSFFIQKIRDLINRYDSLLDDEDEAHTYEKQHPIIKDMKKGAGLIESPLHKVLDDLLIPVAFIVLPVFVFFNAGVKLNPDILTKELAHPVALGIIFGLLFGKFIGIIFSAAIVIKLKIGSMPHGMTTRHLIGGSLLAGIGFTMSIFIASLGYKANPELLLIAKTSVLFASAIAGICGFSFLFFFGSKKERT